MMNVVVVESPAKAKTINKYLGSGYKVLASFGHVRDLRPRMVRCFPTRTSKCPGRSMPRPPSGSRISQTP